MKPRPRVKQTKSLQERLAEFAVDARKEAANMPEGAELKAVKRAETASEIETWASSPGLAPKQPLH